MHPRSPWEEDEDEEEEWRRRLRRKGSSSGGGGLPLLPARATEAEEEHEQSGKQGDASPWPEPLAPVAAAAAGGRTEGEEEEEEEGSATGEAVAALSSSSSAAATGPHHHRSLPPVVLPPAEPTLPPAIARLQRALDRVDGGEAKDEKGGEEKEEGEEEEETGAADAAAIAAAYPHEVEEGWVELLDTRWGRQYYHHAATGKTQWERPAGFRGDTVAPAYEPPPRPFVPTTPAATLAAHTTADAIASWVVEAQGPDVHAAAAAAAAAAQGELTVFEEMGYRASGWDRDKRQLAHFLDPEELERNRAAEARRREEQQRGRGQQQAALGPQEWKRIREEKKAKKRKRDVEWLLTE